jgi:transposase
MTKNTSTPAGAEVRSFEVVLPRQSRGSLRQQETRRRKLARVRGRVIVGLDLAKTRQAVTFSYQSQTLKRIQIVCAPQHLARALQPWIREICAGLHVENAVIAMEPASYYWQLAAEGFEAAGLDYVLLHTLSVKRERETTRYTPEKTDPRDADLASSLAEGGNFTEGRLATCAKRAALDATAREYMLLRARSAAEVARLKSFWGRLLPEFQELLKEPDGVCALAISRALLPFSQMALLSEKEWIERVRAQAEGRILVGVAARLLEMVKAAHADPHRRSGEGMPVRIRMAGERRALLERQKAAVAQQALTLYAGFDEAVLMDSIPGSSALYNAITLGLVGDFRDYDCGRAVVKLAGSEVNHYQSGEWTGRSRISHRGRSLLRTAAYQQAMLLVSAEKVFQARFTHLLGSLTKRQAYMAIADAYLRTAHLLVTSGEPWNEDTRVRRR